MTCIVLLGLVNYSRSLNTLLCWTTYVFLCVGQIKCHVNFFLYKLQWNLNLWLSKATLWVKSIIQTKVKNFKIEFLSYSVLLGLVNWSQCFNSLLVDPCMSRTYDIFVTNTLSWIKSHGVLLGLVNYSWSFNFLLGTYSSYFY